MELTDEQVTDEQVTELAETLTARQVHLLLAQLTVIDTQEIARIVGLTFQRVKTMRHQGDGCDPNHLPPQLPLPGVSPLYLKAEVMEWARQTGRVDSEGNPRRLSPVGRPPKR